jgi:hypothetical protein
MQVYEAEKLDNLSDALKSVSVAMVCPITSTQLLSGDSEIAGITLASISDRPVQADLYYLNSILVSAGWNKNDDVFDVADLWAARETPVDKPFNYMHDETDIIGHMISSAAMGEDGAIINEVPLPDKMDLVTSAVIYKTWGDPDQSIRVNDLIAKIDEGQLAVSMECVFRNFDYAVVEPDGSHKVIARDENSAFLTKHLRAYGGNGTYEGYKIGRLLRDLYFSGKGLVDKPANPRSVILPKEVNPFKPADTFSTLAMEVVMPEDNSALLLVEADVKALKEALTTEKATASTLATEVGTHKATIASLETKVNELEATIATISQEKLTLSQEIQKMVSEVKAAARKNALVTAGATEDKATELLSKFADATDEMFDVVVALIVKPTPVADTESVEVEVETETEALETVTEVDEPAVVVVEDSVADKISVASQWLRASVLQSTKNSK